MLTGRNQPEIIVKAGKPVAVILDLDAYEDMLRRLGDIEGVAVLERVRSITD
jgi:PHD/YefM family antitoxin component YafN of YafNO toxin-antitoxin module